MVDTFPWFFLPLCIFLSSLVSLCHSEENGPLPPRSWVPVAVSPHQLPAAVWLALNMEEHVNTRGHWLRHTQDTHTREAPDSINYWNRRVAESSCRAVVVWCDALLGG